MRIMVITLALLLTLAAPLTVMAQNEGDTVYTDPAGRFTVPVPDGWTNASDDSGAHFVSAEPAADLYVLAVEAADVTTGIAAALEQLFPGWDADPLQSVQAPLPNGTWTQNVYMQGTELVIALGQDAGDAVVVMVARGAQAALQTVNPVMLATLGGIALLGAEIVLPDYIDPTAFTETEVEVGAEGWPLPGTLTMPVGDGPFAAAVLVHGSGPNDRDLTLGPNKAFRDLAQGLASQGIAVLRYDKRTLIHGERVVADPNFTVYDEYVDDALAGIAWLRSLDSIDPARVYAIGISQGAMVAPHIAVMDPDIGGVVIMAGLARPFEASIYEQLDYQLALAEEYGEELTPQAQATLDALREIADNLAKVRAGADPAEVFGVSGQAAYWGSVVENDPLADLAVVDVPVLILQGGRDYQATMEDFALFQEALAGHDNVTLKSYPALNHLFMETGEVGTLAAPSEYATVATFVDAEVIADIAAWIAQQ